MNVFQAAKDADMLAVATWLGFEVKRIRGDRGVMCCPFHAENTPSMYLYAKGGDNHYYCFGCREHGDPTDLFARTQGVRSLDAARAICSNFGLMYDQALSNPPQPVRIGPCAESKILCAAVQAWREDRVNGLRSYYNYCHERLSEMIAANLEYTDEFQQMLFASAQTMEEAERWLAMDVPSILMEIREAVERHLPPQERRIYEGGRAG